MKYLKSLGIIQWNGGCRGRDRMVFGTYAISTYHH